MIQNIATEKVRVYERCEPKAGEAECAHRMILETDMTAGEDTPDRSRQTMLGSYKITKWYKFYQDTANAFPAWYREGYPQLPPAGADIVAWTSRSLLPNGQGSVRGSFGWYTAHIGPNSREQWTHGTLGWGKDGGKFIHLTREDLGNYYADQRSHGCTRVENQAIAFMREILPVGTRVVKIYAKEAYRDPSRKRYKAQPRASWPWILSADGAGLNGVKSDEQHALARRVSSSQILDSGTYIIDQMPDADPFLNIRNGQWNENGNLYEQPESELRGYFVVDEGRLVNYAHPRKLRVGGFTDKVLPSFMVSTQSKVFVPSARSTRQPGKQQVLQGQAGVDQNHQGPASAQPPVASNAPGATVPYQSPF